MARILLDTHVFLWLVVDSAKLTKKAKALIEDSEQVFVSSASIWEVSIKVRLGKLRADPEMLIEEIQKNGFEELPVYARHATEIAKLPMDHEDPFDRLLVAQAIVESARLITSDKHLAGLSDFVVAV
jgi:PIN domain nuclease of toxin-antitoxin system